MNISNKIYYIGYQVVSCIPHLTCTIAQCVGKRRVMSVKKFLASFVSRQSAAGILAKSEVFAPATSTVRVSFVTSSLRKRKVNLEFLKS